MSAYRDLTSLSAQIKPLTEEEKKQKLAELREKMAAKRAAKAKEEAKEHLANEAIRRKSGKVCHTNFVLTACIYKSTFQDINELREELKQKELIKEAEAKRRGTSSPLFPLLRFTP